MPPRGPLASTRSRGSQIAPQSRQATLLPRKARPPDMKKNSRSRCGFVILLRFLLRRRKVQRALCAARRNREEHDYFAFDFRPIMRCAAVFLVMLLPKP